MLDRIIFGDNQFFGINHMSEDKAQALEEKFKATQPCGVNLVGSGLQCCNLCHSAVRHYKKRLIVNDRCWNGMLTIG
jgi:hypothetical protein